MREELGRSLGGSVEILGLGHGMGQGASVEKHCELALTEQCAQFRATRMEAVGVAVVVSRSVSAVEVENVRLRNRQDGRANGCVVVVFRLKRGDDEVVRVV